MLLRKYRSERFFPPRLMNPHPAIAADTWDASADWVT